MMSASALGPHSQHVERERKLPASGLHLRSSALICGCFLLNERCLATYSTLSFTGHGTLRIARYAALVCSSSTAFVHLPMAITGKYSL